MQREVTAEDRRPCTRFPEEGCEGWKRNELAVELAKMCPFLEIPRLHRYHGVVPSLCSLRSCYRNLHFCGIRGHLRHSGEALYYWATSPALVFLFCLLLFLPECNLHEKRAPLHSVYHTVEGWENVCQWNEWVKIGWILEAKSEKIETSIYEDSVENLQVIRCGRIGTLKDKNLWSHWGLW